MQANARVEKNTDHKMVLHALLRVQRCRISTTLLIPRPEALHGAAVELDVA